MLSRDTIASFVAADVTIVVVVVFDVAVEAEAIAVGVAEVVLGLLADAGPVMADLALSSSLVAYLGNDLHNAPSGYKCNNYHCQPYRFHRGFYYTLGRARFSVGCFSSD